MNDNEIPISAGPHIEHHRIVVESLNQEGIPARIVMIRDVDPARRPEWACTPGNEIYIVVPKEQRDAALEIVRWTGRICVNCETTLLAKVRNCQKCGTLHPREPGPVW